MNSSDLLPPEVLHSDSDPVLEFEANLEEAANALDLEPWVLQRLKHPEREITINFPLVRGDGAAVNITGYRIQHSRAQGPCVGPIILSPTAHLASLRLTAAEITLQSALLGLRLGGAAGAIVIDPEQLSERELRHVIKTFINMLHENSGPLSDILACDGNPCIASWMDSANTHARGQNEPAAVVGKPPDGEVLNIAWARTVVALIGDVVGTKTMNDTRIAIQGFGRHGQLLASALDSNGAKVIGIADRSGGLMRTSGIDVRALQKYVSQSGVGFGYTGAEAVTNSDVLECDCDVLVLAAAPRQIGAHNGHRIRARYILELTPGAVTDAGKQVLSGGVLVPSLIASAAQLAVWSHEWQHGLTYSAPDPVQAEAEATALVRQAFGQAQRTSSERCVSLHSAAMMLATERLSSSVRLV